MGIDYYSIFLIAYNLLLSLSENFNDNVGIFLKVFTEMSMWAQSSFRRKI